jgi:hypothetical protein
MRQSARLMPMLACAAMVACSPRTEPEPPVAPLPLTADMMANLMAADGAAHTVAVLTGPADPTGIDKVFAGIATGAPEWLALVPDLKPALGAPHAEGLQRALAAALPHNAPGVLALVPDYTEPRGICTADARAAVEAVGDPALQTARAECLGVIEAAASDHPES